MDTVNVTFALPEDLVIRARKAGKLTTEYLILLLEKDLEREFRANRLLLTMDRIQAAEPLINEGEIAQEIGLARQEKQYQ